MSFKRLKKETKLCIDSICNKYGVTKDDVKLFGNSVGDYTKEDLDRMTDAERFEIKKLLISKLNKY